MAYDDTDVWSDDWGKMNSFLPMGIMMANNY